MNLSPSDIKTCENALMVFNVLYDWPDREYGSIEFSPNDFELEVALAGGTLVPHATWTPKEFE